MAQKHSDFTQDLPEPDARYLHADDYEARRFGKRRTTQKIDRWEKDLARHVFALAGPDNHVLDAPCGTGRFFDTFVQAKQLTLLDRSAHMLDVCRQRAAGHAHARVVLADITAIPLPDASVDVTWCMRLFHHLPTDEIRSAVLEELGRVTRKMVALTFYNSRSTRYIRRRISFSKFRGQYTSYQNLIALAAKFGLTPIERRPWINLFQQQCFVLFKKT